MLTSGPAHRAGGTNPLAIAALVCGILQVGGVWPIGIVAVILGYKARRQIFETGQGGLGMAQAGLILGYVGIALMVLILLIMILAFTSSP